MVVTVVGMVQPWMILGVGCRIGYHLVPQNGRLLVRLGALERQLAQLSSVTSVIGTMVVYQPRAVFTSA
jgi:hypothetical protein